MTGRCYACCQENCGYSRCSCTCHFGHEKPAPAPTVGIMAHVHTEDFTGLALERCINHYRYQAKRRPTGNCEACWRYYFQVNP